MARPVNADTANKIIIHTNGGHRYASTKTFSTDDVGFGDFSNLAVKHCLNPVLNSL